MKLKFVCISVILFWSLTTSAQWIAKAGFPGISRAKSTAFTLGNKIYVLGGVSNAGLVLADFWEYDIVSNTWSQQPNFPGPERYGAVSFVLNNKGYVATGGNDFGYLDDCWEFNPLTNSWIQKTGLPAGSAQHENQRTESYAFTIGNKAYLGGGEGFVFGANSTNNTAFYDLWEYDPSTNSWQPKADIPDFIGRDMSVAVAINNKGYVGLGCDVWQTTNHQSFWEYDPLLNSWAPKAAFPTLHTVDAGAFVLGSNLYVAGGVSLMAPVTLSNQLYKYDPVTNAWLLLPVFNGGAIAGEFAVSTGTAAFIGTGYDGTIVTRADLWTYTPSPTGLHDMPGESEMAVRIFPNPASDELHIYSQKNISRLEVYDMAGKKILEELNNRNALKIQSLASGMYSLKMFFPDGSNCCRRFVKNN